MKIVIALLALVAAAVVLATVAGPGGWTSQSPIRSCAGWDGYRRAFRQETVRTATSEGTERVHEITVIGAGPELVDPWLDIEFDMEGMSLHPFGGSRVRVPPDRHTAWRTAAGHWNFSEAKFPALDDVVTRLRGDFDSDLFAELRARFPDEAVLIDRIEADVSSPSTRPSGGAR